MKRTYFVALLLGLAFNASVRATSLSTDSPSNPMAMLPIDTPCHLSLGSGRVDYGNLSHWQLRSASTGGDALTPGKRILTLNVVCPYAQPLRLVMHGESGTNGELRYGERGSMVVRLSDMRVDGQNVQIMNVTPSGDMKSTALEVQPLKPEQVVGAAINNQLVNGKTLTARLEIEPVMLDDELRVKSSTVKESLLTLELMD